MRSLLAKLFLIFGMLASSAGLAQGPIWQLDEIAAYRGQSDNRNKAYFSSEFQALRSLLRAAPAESSGDNSYLISLPKPDGSRARYSIVESPVMAQALADQFPEIKTYRIFGIDDPSAGGRVDITPRGFHAMVHTDRGRFTIDPEAGLYRVKWQKGGDGSSSFQCRTESLASRGEDPLGAGSGPAAAGAPAARIPSSLQVYRLAVSATVEYVTAVGGTQGAAMSEIATAVNRVNSIYERDLGIRLQLVANNEQLIELDGSPRVSPTNLDNNDLTSLINQNQSWIDTILGSANYDIGHIFSTANGGLAFTSSACSSGNKSKGGTGLATPSGETFYIDYVAHELGHQFGAEHSFNGTTGSCLTSRVGSSAYEPGSGSTIMAYAGICGAENIQQNSDATFNSWSIFQIGSYTSGAGNCYTTTSANNANDPTANAGLDRNIPMGTPFQLQGSGSDGDGDTLSYQWDQVNKGFSTNATTLGDDLGNNPLFRTYLPQPTGSRDFPALGTQVCGQTDLSEALPTRTRNLVFRLTVRDNKSGQAIDPVTVAVNSAIGPFRITSHTTASQITPGPVNVTWDVANTTAAPVSCANVDIDLLTFTPGHSSYSVTSLASGTANDGSASVNIPNNSNSQARFRVKCSNNVFYDISDADLDIQGGSSFPTNGQATFFNSNGTVLNPPAGSCSTGPDVTPPVITLLGSTPVGIEQGSSYVDAGATALDNVDGNITGSIVTTSTVNTNVVGSYSVTYNVIDAAGNAAIPVVRIVNVTADTIPPMVTPPSNITVAATNGSGTAATDAVIAAFLNGASALDNIDGVISTVTDDAPAVFPLGVTTVTFSATDSAGNTSTAQATVTVTDQTAPVITLTGPDTIPIELGTPYSDLGATAFDNVDGDISGGIVTNSNVNTNLVGSYSVTYNVSDAAGNAATQVIRTVVVTPDATPPMITLLGTTPMSIELGTPYIDAGATATDNIDGDITGGIVTTSTVNTNAVGSYSVTYNVSDAAGNAATPVTRTVNVTEDVTADVTAPVVTAPVDIVTASQGSVTSVVLGLATAIDNVDGVILASPDQSGPFVPGRHQILWSATDASGNTGFAIQLVDVQPLVEFLPDQLSEPGAAVTVRVLLNGEAAAYPVGVNYEIFEGSSSIPSGSGVLTITAGIEGDFDYVIPGNILAGDINFNLTTVTNAVKGPMAIHKVSVISENVAPLARSEITQNGILTNIITADGGPVTVQALVQDINFADNHIYDWSKSDNLLLASNPGASNAQFMIDPGGFLPGYYKIDVKVTDDGLPNLDTEIELYLELVDTAPLLSTEDSDNDGIDDSTEGFGDADSDGIPDYLDGLDNPVLMQAKAGVFDQWLMNAQPGLGIRLGTISLVAGRHSATINADDIEQIAGTLGGAVLSNATDNYTNVGGYFDFEIHGLTQPGQAVLVVIPQLAPIPQAAVYRKYTETGGWRSFVEDSKNVLSSTAGEAGICPAPGDSAYVPGLNQGHYCVQLLIEDGGANDGDVRRNGIIKDPGGVARLSVAPPAASSGSGGGGSMGLFVLLLMLSLQRLNARLRHS